MSNVVSNNEQVSSRCSKHIYLIDDDPAARTLLRILLEHQGYHCIEAEEGTPALAHLQEGHTVDLVLTDNRMPHMNGLEFLRKLPESLTSPPPVILYSGQLTEDIKNQAFQLGAFAVLRKPYTFPEILQTVSQALEMKS